MCRLTLLSTDKADYSTRSTLLHYAMLLQVPGEGIPQLDGWGITDGSKTIKGTDPYHLSGVDWLKELSPEGGGTGDVLMSHLRYATPNTPKNAPHPFSVDIEGSSLQVVHNGVFKGRATKAQSDTQVAVSDMTNFFKKESDLWEPKNWEDWLSENDEGTAYVVLVRHPDLGGTFLVRNSLRELHCVDYRGGLLSMTSRDVLETMVKYYITSYTSGDILTYNPGILIWIPDNTTDLVNLGEVKPVFNKFICHTPVTRMGYHQHDYKKTMRDNLRSRRSNRKTMIQGDKSIPLIPLDLEWSSLSEDNFSDGFKLLISKLGYKLTYGMLALWAAHHEKYYFQDKDDQTWYDLYKAVSSLPTEGAEDIIEDARTNAYTSGILCNNNISVTMSNKLDKLYGEIDTFLFWWLGDLIGGGNNLANIVEEYSLQVLADLYNSGIGQSPIFWDMGVLTHDEIEYAFELLVEDVQKEQGDNCDKV